MTRLKHFFLKLLSWLLPARLCLRLMRKEIKNLTGALEGALVDKFVEFLLWGMSLAFLLLRDFRRNIAGFSATYVFRAAHSPVAAGARFANGQMHVLCEEEKHYDVVVTFKDSTAFCRFLFSRDQDILASILANDVSVDGNLNYIYKFAFMVRDLMHRLRVADLVDRLLARLRVA
jgi:hypothetical protein